VGWLSTFRARRKNELGNHLRAQGDRDRAGRAYRDAIRFEPSWEAPWFNLGLIHKEDRNWPEAVQCNLKAIELCADNPPAYWNLGIAATVVERWDLARMAWARYGVKLPAGEGPINGDFGLTPVRVNVDHRPEVVWCRRLDPARTLIESVPSPDCGRRWHDLLLNDGEPRGYRRLGEREVPVFNELQLLKPSAAHTFVAEVTAPAESDSEALGRSLDEAGWAGEDWTANFQMLCAACSEGRPGDAHRHAPDESASAWKSARRFGIAADTRDRAERLLEAWSAAAVGREIQFLEQVL
jgi:hypothetical protein